MSWLSPARSTRYQSLNDNFWNLLYLGEIYMGSDMQKFWVVWDTGSGGYLARTSDCDGRKCDGDKFQIS